MIYVTIDDEEYITDEVKIKFMSGRTLNITSDYIDLCENNKLTETFLIDKVFEDYFLENNENDN